MKRILTVGTASVAMVMAACSDSASASINASSLANATTADDRYTFDQDGDVSLMGSDMDVSGRIGGALSLVGSDLTVSAAIGQSMSLVGSDVEFEGSVGGEVNIAGSDVDWRGSAERDIDIAGSDVNWAGSTGQDLSIAGSDVTISGRINGDLDVAGSDIRIDEASLIAQNASLAGSDLDLFGTVSGNADLAGSRLRMTGTIEGRLIGNIYPEGQWRRRMGGDDYGLARIDGRVGSGSAICARRIEFGENADISGTLTVFADEAPLYDNRRVETSIQFEAVNGRDCDDLLEPYNR